MNAEQDRQLWIIAGPTGKAMKNKMDIFDMSKEESETHLAKATRKAIAETHAAGRPTAHGDDKGVYRLYPDGHKEYVKLYGNNPPRHIENAMLACVGAGLASGHAVYVNDMADYPGEIIKLYPDGRREIVRFIDDKEVIVTELSPIPMSAKLNAKGINSPER